MSNETKPNIYLDIDGVLLIDIVKKSLNIITIIKRFYEIIFKPIIKAN